MNIVTRQLHIWLLKADIWLSEHVALPIAKWLDRRNAKK